MSSYKDKLINRPEMFLRERLEERKQKYGFKNMIRLEKFLWDLEIFQQIQKRSGDKVILKGGAAVQFYLPIEAQRASVDIDMIFAGTRQEAESILEDIKREFNEIETVMEWRPYIPKNPRTALPLYTYTVNLPTSLTSEELRGKDGAEIKVEFIMEQTLPEHTMVSGKDIFAGRSDIPYQILPLNDLFADKLTTLGPDTIGVGNGRLDEQVKQFYDILMLARYQFREFDIARIRESYLKRARQEMKTRGREYDLDAIKEDVRRQLLRYKTCDSGTDPLLRREINGFKSLYLKESIMFNPQMVSSGASLVELIYEIILENGNKNIVEQAFECETILEFAHLEGKNRGEKKKLAREIIPKEFGASSCIDIKELKGKRPVRMFWAVANKENIIQIRKRLLEIAQYPSGSGEQNFS